MSDPRPVQSDRASAGAHAHVLVQIFRTPDYARLWLSGLCVNAARWMDLVVLGWLAFELTGSPFMVGLAGFARAAPLMAIGPLAGVIADRIRYQQVLLATQWLGLVTAGVLALTFATGHGGYRPLVGLSTLFGVVWALDFPARRTAIFGLVGPGRLANAVSLETVSMQLAKIAGPVSAGLLLARLGPAVSFGAVAAVYLIGLLVLAGSRAGLAQARLGAAVSIRASLGEGLRAAWAQPTVRAVLLITIAMNVLCFPYQQMLPVFARDVLHGGPEWLGALVAADGLGALLGALVIAARRELIPGRRLFASAVLVGPVVLVAFAATPSRLLCLGLLVLMGVAEAGFAAMQTTLVLLSAPERARGGVMGILSACIGTNPLGTLWIGGLTGWAGISWALAINALAALAVILPVARPLLRDPAPSPE